MKAIADATYGFVGRSPDQVSGLITGLAMNSGILEKLRAGFGQNLLNYYDLRAQQRSLSQLCRHAGERPQERRPVPRPAARRSQPAGRRRGRRRRHRVRHEDDGDQRGLCRRNPDRQPHADRGQVQKRGDHRGDAAQRAGRVAVVAPALCARREARGRLSDVVSLRRDRQRAGVRPREDSVAARVPAQRRQHVAAHLHRDAGELLPEPPVQHPLLVQDGPDRRRREPHLPGQRHRQDSGGARGARPHGGVGSDRSAGWCRARSRRGRIGPKATPRRTAASCMAR